MKKLRQFNFIEQRIRHKRSEYKKRRRKRFLAEKRGGNVVHIPKSTVSPVPPMLRRDECPKNVCLKTNQAETIRFLNFVCNNNHMNRKNRRKPRVEPKSYFDFTLVENICPASALILCSVYDVFQSRNGTFRVYDWENWQPAVKDIFLKIGFFNWLNFKGIATSVVEQDLPIQAFQSDTSANSAATGTYLETLVRSFNDARQAHNSEGVPLQTLKDTAAAILEAVENSVRHAYTGAHPKDVRRKWWIGGISSPENGEITLMCYDAGVSIPGHIESSDMPDETQVRSYVRKVIDRFQNGLNSEELENNLDHKRLEIAMRYLSSSTMRQGAGRGLSYIASTIEDFADGEIEIFSRRAHLEIKRSKKSKYRLLSYPLPGTLIIWRIKL